MIGPSRHYYAADEMFIMTLSVEFVDVEVVVT